MKRLLYCRSYITLIAMHCNAKKITSRFQRSLTWYEFSFSYFSGVNTWNDNFSIVSKKQNNHAIFRLLASRSRAPHVFSSLLILLSSLYTQAYCICYALGYACSYLVLRFSSLLLVSRTQHVASHVLCILPYMYTLHAWPASCFHYVHASLLYLYTSSRASWLYALTSYHTLHYCSVPVQRTSRQS